MIERVTHDGNVLGIIIKRNFSANGVKFVTPDKYPQQLGYISYGEGDVIDAHEHPDFRREIHRTQEVLFVRKGKVKVLFYTRDRELSESVVIEQGDVVLLAEGGHGFEMLEDTELIEVKQGPYNEDKDKIRFDITGAE